jgi:ABC-type bacteriocin/lantibiotic exporter with double-glycine peptidase domain
MKNTHQCLKFFTAQSGPNDCGLACMAMVLNYCGRRAEANSLMKQTVAGGEGMSLLDIRRLAESMDLSGRCVRMDLTNLREAGSPCILHVGKSEARDHFVVSFGSRKKKGVHHYLIADPAIGVQLMDENELVRIWQGNAALYFESLPADLAGQYRPLWMQLLQIKTFRNALLLTVPLLNLCATLLGIGVSWMLQRGLDHSYAEQRLSLLAALLVLLFIITFFKNVINYVRRHLLILLSSSISEHLNTTYVKHLLSGRPGAAGQHADSVRNALREIKRIQHAATTLVSVLASEALMMTAIIAALLFYDPLVGGINICYALISLDIAKSRVPETILESVKLQQLSGDYEHQLIIESPVNGHSDVSIKGQERHFKKIKSYHNYAKSVANRVSGESLLYEFVGTVNIVAVFSVGIYKLQKYQIGYRDLIVEVVLSYFMIALVPRICNALAIVTDGALPVQRFLGE